MTLQESLAKLGMEDYHLFESLVVTPDDKELLWEKMIKEADEVIAFSSSINSNNFKMIPSSEFEKFSLKTKNIQKAVYGKLLEKFYNFFRENGIEKKYIETMKESSTKMNLLKKNGVSMKVDNLSFSFYLTHFGIQTLFSTPMVGVPEILSYFDINPTKDNLVNLFIAFRMIPEEIEILRELYTFSKYSKN